MRLFLIILIFINTLNDVNCVLLEVNPYVQKGHTIQLNCSADSIPVDKTVEFLANDETVTNIRKHEGVCFDTIHNRVCSSKSCSCSANDRYYVLFFRPPYGRTKTTFQCKMKLIRTGILYSNKVIVTILDLPTPSIQIDSALPLVSGTTAKLKCEAKKTNERFLLTWKCGHITYDNGFMSNDTAVWSHLLLKVDSSYNNIQCQCIVRSQVAEISLTNKVTFDVQNTPILTLNEEFYCNNSNPVVIICTARGELGMFGFSSWIHSVNNSNIRSINGTTDKYNSVLIIKDCSFRDEGTYTCSVWNKDSNETLWANRSTKLTVAAPPFIVNSDFKKDRNEWHLSIQFYTRSALSLVDWRCNGVSLLNISSTGENLKRLNIDLIIYDRKLSVHGYLTYFTTSQHDCSFSDYDICLTNAFGRRCEKIKIALEQTGVNTFWIMLGVVMTILTAGSIAASLTVRSKQKKTGSMDIQIDVEGPPVVERYPIRDIVPQDGIHLYENSGRPYENPIPYQPTRVYNRTSRDYLDVQPDIDSLSTNSDQYEKVD